MSCAPGGSPYAPPIAPLPLPRSMYRQAVFPVNCLSCWRTPLVGFLLVSELVAHLLAIFARAVVSGCYCCFLAYDRGFLQALCRLQQCPLLSVIQYLPFGQLWATLVSSSANNGWYSSYLLCMFGSSLTPCASLSLAAVL